MKRSTEVLDKNKKLIYEGNFIGIPWVSPFGDVDKTYDPEQVYEVVFYKGAFCLKLPNSHEPLMYYFKKEVGEYIPNYGNKVIITDDFVGEIVNKMP